METATGWRSSCWPVSNKLKAKNNKTIVKMKKIIGLFLTNTDALHKNVFTRYLYLGILPDRGRIGRLVFLGGNALMCFGKMIMGEG